MFEMLPLLLRYFRAYFQSRADLQIEILALRHQIIGCNGRLPSRLPSPNSTRPIGDSGSVCPVPVEFVRMLPSVCDRAHDSVAANDKIGNSARIPFRFVQ